MSTVDSFGRVTPTEDVGTAPTLDGPVKHPDLDGRTVMGLPTPQAVKEALAASSEGEGAADTGRTVFGLPSPFAGVKPSPAPVEAAPAAPPEKSEEAKTLFGLPSPFAPAAEPTSPSPDPPAAVSEPADTKKTLFGIPAPAAASVDENAKTLFGLPSPVAEAADTQKTIMGLPSILEMQRAAEEAERRTATPAPPEDEVGRRTLFGAPGVVPATPDQDATRQVQPASPVPADRVAGTAPAGLVSTAAARPAVKARAPTPRTSNREESRERAELYAAAKFAAAIAADERVHGRARQRKALMALLVVTLLAAAAAVIAFRHKTALQVELVGEPRVTRGNGAFAVDVTVRASAPSTVGHPGGETPGEGEWGVAFSIPEGEMKVGENVFALRVTDEKGGAVELPVRVILYYRFHVPSTSPPKVGTPVKAYVEVPDGWKVAVAGGQVREAGSRFELALDPAPVLTPDSNGVLQARLTLTSPEGEKKFFAETLKVPIPEAPLRLLAPARGWRRAAETVSLRGRTLAGARVEVGSVVTAVGPDGLFEIAVPVEQGSNTISLRLQIPGRRSVGREVSVERLTSRQVRQEKRRLERLSRVFLRGARRTPPYPKMLSASATLQGQKVRVRGRLVEVRRSQGLDELQVATCGNGGGCPVWVRLDGPILASQGDVVTVVGILAGVHRFRRAGEMVEAPQLDAKILVP